MTRYGFVVMLLLATGCGTPPRVEPPLVVTVPTEWIAPADSTPVGEAWWSRLGGAELDSLIPEMLMHNHDLKAAAARVEGAGAQARAAGADLWPTLSLGVSATRQQQNFIGLPVPGDAPVLTSLSTSYGVSLDTSWEIDLWGRIRSGRSAAFADVGAAEADWRAAALSLIGQTTKAWFALVDAHTQVELARERRDSFAASADAVRDRYGRGLTTALDLRLMSAERENAEAALRAVLQTRDAAARQLEVLLGRYPSASVAAADALPALEDTIPAGVPASLVARRPELVAAERRCAAAGARVTEAKRALYPRLSLTGSAGRTSDVVDDLTNADFNVWRIVGNLVQPLLQGGRLRANVDARRAVEAELLQAYAGLVLRAYAEVENALSQETRLEERESHAREAASHAEAAYRLAEDQYRQGLVTVITVLDAQRRALASRSEFVTLRRLRLENRVDLMLALGGDFKTEDGVEAEAS